MIIQFSLNIKDKNGNSGIPYIASFEPPLNFWLWIKFITFLLKNILTSKLYCLRCKNIIKPYFLNDLLYICEI